MDESSGYDYSIFQEKYPLPLHDVENKTKEQILLIATIYFAKNGYSSATMREIARIVGVQQSSLYNHFESKEALWREVIMHAKHLYMVYFGELEKQVAQAGSFEEVLELIFHEPKLMRNVFTCYAFSMVQAEQFRDENVKDVFCDTFLQYSIGMIRGWFDDCVAKGMVEPFDTGAAAAIIMHSTLISIEMSVHKHSNKLPPTLDDPYKTLGSIQQFILHSVTIPKN